MSWCRACGAVVSDDVRPVSPSAEATHDLVEGARQRGFSEAQIDYLRGCIGVTWAKSFRAGQLAAGGAP